MHGESDTFPVPFLFLSFPSSLHRRTLRVAMSTLKHSLYSDGAVCMRSPDVFPSCQVQKLSRLLGIMQIRERRRRASVLVCTSSLFSNNCSAPNQDYVTSKLIPQEGDIKQDSVKTLYKEAKSSPTLLASSCSLLFTSSIVINFNRTLSGALFLF